MRSYLKPVFALFCLIAATCLAQTAHAEVQCHRGRMVSVQHTHHYNGLHVLNSHLKLTRSPRSASHHHEVALSRDVVLPEQDSGSGNGLTPATPLTIRNLWSFDDSATCCRPGSRAMVQAISIYQLKNSYLI